MNQTLYAGPWFNPTEHSSKRYENGQLPVYHKDSMVDIFSDIRDDSVICLFCRKKPMDGDFPFE